MKSPHDADLRTRTKLSISTNTALNTAKQRCNKVSLLDRVLSSTSGHFDPVGPSNNDSTTLQPLLIHRPSLDNSQSSDNREPRAHTPGMPQTQPLPVTFHPDRKCGRIGREFPLTEVGLGIAMGDAGYSHGLMEGFEQAGPASSPTLVSPVKYNLHYSPQQASKMIDPQHYSQQFMDQQHYPQQVFYQDSSQEQARVFYLQPHSTMQYSYPPLPDISDGQQQMFAYPVGPEQAMMITPPNLLSDHNMMDGQNGIAFPQVSLDGRIDPPSPSVASVMMANNVFAMAPATTISPSSLQHAPCELEHSPLTSISDVDSFVNPHFQPFFAEHGPKKRRMSSESGQQEEQEESQTASSSSQAAQNREQPCEKPARKRSRKDTTEENAMDTSNTSDYAMSDAKPALMAAMHKDLGTGKKRFKPWNTSPASSHLPSGSECINPITGEVSLPNLENLTKEEIRKVKNRASAQRSRTRKSEQTFELRLENAKLMERIELLKTTLQEARPDLRASLALDKAEPSLLCYDNGLPRCEGMTNEDEETQNMQMVILGLRSQLDAERNQRVAAEQKVSKLQRELELLSSPSSQSSVSTASPISPKLTLDQVAERENAIRIVRMTSDLGDADMDDDVLCSAPNTPIFHKVHPVTAPSSCGRLAGCMTNSEKVRTSKNDVLSSVEQKGALMFVMMVSMALFAMPTAMRSSNGSQPERATTSAATQATSILRNIRQSTVSAETAKRTITLTLLKPVNSPGDLERLSQEACSLSEAKSESELNQAAQTWLRPATVYGGQQDSSSPRGWITVKSDNSNIMDDMPQDGPTDFWRDHEIESIQADSKMFSMLQSDPSDRRSAIADLPTFPMLFAPDSAMWQKGPSPTLGPLILEDPFADIDGASDLSDLQTQTRASTVFDDQASSFLSSRRTSIHSARRSDDLNMIRSVSALPSIRAVSSFEKTAATKFAKFDIEIELSTQIEFNTARSKSSHADLLDRSAAARLLSTGNSFPQ